MRLDFAVETTIPGTSRIRQLEAMFDVPPSEKSRIRWQGDVPLENEPWSVGLIVGPSGSGKTTIARHLFDGERPVHWDPERSAIDCFADNLGLETITQVCQSVGFNTVPAWMRPHHVLSNGEQFRANIARRLVETPADEVCVVDEFTSVVDRQVGMIVAHAVAKWTRRNERRFVAVTCHYDVEEWLQPDWVIEPVGGDITFRRRSVQPRPGVDVEISPAPRAAWRMFAPFHYLTADVHPAAKMFVAYANGEPAAIAAVMQQPGHKGIKSLSRLVTLPDWQGLGLAFRLADTIGAALRAKRTYFHSHPAHPKSMHLNGGKEGERPCASFRYCGPALPLDDANRLLVPHLLAS